MNDLIGRLEAATGPDRELDCLIYGHLHWPNSDKWRAASLGSSHTEIPFRWAVVRRTVDPHEVIISDDAILCFTASIDAALTLVPEDCGWVINWQGGQCARCFPASGDENVDEWGVESGDVATPAIALCIAALKARAAMIGDKRDT